VRRKPIWPLTHEARPTPPLGAVSPDDVVGRSHRPRAGAIAVISPDYARPWPWFRSCGSRRSGSTAPKRVDRAAAAHRGTGHPRSCSRIDTTAETGSTASCPLTRSTGNAAGGRRSGPSSPHDLRRGGGGWVLGGAARAASASRRRVVTGSARGIVRDLVARPNKPSAGREAREAPARAFRIGQISSARETVGPSRAPPKLDPRRPARLHSIHVLRARPRPPKRSVEAEHGRESAARGDSRVERSVGCSCRHVDCRGRLDASSPTIREDRGMARRGGSSQTRRARFAAGERVRGARG